MAAAGGANASGHMAAHEASDIRQNGAQVLARELAQGRARAAVEDAVEAQLPRRPIGGRPSTRSSRRCCYDGCVHDRQTEASAFSIMSAAAPAPGAPLHPAGSSGAAAPTLTVPPAAGVVEEQSSSAGAFLQSGLTLLYKYASKKHEALRHQCVEVLSKIKAEEKSRAEKLARGSVQRRPQAQRTAVALAFDH